VDIAVQNEFKEAVGRTEANLVSRQKVRWKWLNFWGLIYP